MQINSAGSQPSTKGSADNFTGNVRIDPLFQINEPRRSMGVSVTFEPGAHGVAHASVGTDAHRDRGMRARAVLG